MKPESDFFQVPIDSVEWSLAAQRMAYTIGATEGYSLDPKVSESINTLVDRMRSVSEDYQTIYPTDIGLDFIRRIAVTFMLLGYEVAQVKAETNYMARMPGPSDFEC